MMTIMQGCCTIRCDTIRNCFFSRMNEDSRLCKLALHWFVVQERATGWRNDGAGGLCGRNVPKSKIPADEDILLPWPPGKTEHGMTLEQCCREQLSFFGFLLRIVRFRFQPRSRNPNRRTTGGFSRLVSRNCESIILVTSSTQSRSWKSTRSFS